MEYSEVEDISDLSEYGYDDARVVKFFSFAAEDKEGNRDRVDLVELDSLRKLRRQPHVCMVCHGGRFPLDFPSSKEEFDDANKEELVAAFKTSRSSFREFDLGSIRNLQGIEAGAPNQAT